MPVKAAGDFNTGLIKFTGNDFGTADPAMLKNCSRLVSLNIDEIMPRFTFVSFTVL